MEKKIEALFGKHKKRLVKKFGIKALDNHTINEYCSEKFKGKFKGSYAVDERFSLKPGYYVINTDKSAGSGIHWVSLIITSKNATLYDSFGRRSDTLLKILVNRLKANGFKIIDSDRSDKEQKDVEIICGHLCISFLHIAAELGVAKARLI